MSKATTIDLVETLLLGLDDDTAISDLYDDVIIMLGSAPIITNAAAQQSFAFFATYPEPAAAIMPLAVFFGDRETPLTELNALESQNGNWRGTSTGTPVVATQDTEREGSITFFPAPAAGSAAPTGVFATDFGAGFDPNFVSFIFTEDRQDVMAWLELMIALEVAGREMAREGEQMDSDAAAAFFKLSQVIRAMVLRPARNEVNL